jgi:alkylation response protein AidB-like acyl-CoA dehydrogenase
VILDLDDDEAAVVETFGDFFRKEVGPDRVRASEPLGFDDRLWDQLVDMGAPTMAVPEALGGGGARRAELALVAELVGRHVAPVPFVETAAAANLLAATAAGDLVGAVANGAVATLALRAPTNGICRLVPAGAVADVVVVLDGDELVALRRMAGTRPYLTNPPNLAASPTADVPLAGASYERVVLATGTDAQRLYADAVSDWKLLMAAALEGIRAEALRIGVEYVKE